ncbi:MAG: hypothetical protein LKJ47_06105 [Bifidobacteriaceae bacterium]|jgi:hypothetical protein|nr:hypothetical protein [Bifidobacteriaceae bacterium]
MALVADEYTWIAGTIATQPSIDSPEDGHHLVVRFSVKVDRKGGASVEQPVEARGATAKYLQAHNVKKGDFVMAAGIIRTDDAAGVAGTATATSTSAAVSDPYLLLRIVSTDTSESLGE